MPPPRSHLIANRPSISFTVPNLAHQRGRPVSNNRHHNTKDITRSPPPPTPTNAYAYGILRMYITASSRMVYYHSLMLYKTEHLLKIIPQAGETKHLLSSRGKAKQLVGRATPSGGVQ